MSMNPLSYDHPDDDFIDMDIASSYSNVFCQQSAASPQHPREFEFQMSLGSIDKGSTTSPADELFYDGKLLPLHLPPCFNVVEKFLQHPNPVYDKRRDRNEEYFSTPMATTTATTPAFSSTPFESCNISPSESCPVSGELNLEEHVQECSKDMAEIIRENPKKSWTKKMKLIKQSSLSSKLKASRAYLKSFFGKSGCSEGSSAGDSQNKHYADNCEKERIPFGQIQRYRNQSTGSCEKLLEKEKNADIGSGSHRRSFSVSIKWHLSNKVSSSSTSSKSSPPPLAKKSSGSTEIQFLRRSSSAKSETESPIQGAIAYCKRSQQLFRLRKIDA